MKEHLLGLVVVSAVLTALITPAKAADPAAASDIGKLVRPSVEYEADQIFTGRQGKSFTTHVNHTAKMERREMTSQQANMISILRRDRKLMWNVMPAQQMYMEISLDAEKLKNMPGRAIDRDPAEDWKNAQVKLTNLGSDAVNGLAATKYEAIVTTQGGQPRRHLIWIADAGVMVQMQGFADLKATEPDFQVSLSNVKIGPQNPALFEVPSGYRKLDMGTMGLTGAPMGGGMMNHGPGGQ